MLDGCVARALGVIAAMSLALAVSACRGGPPGAGVRHTALGALVVSVVPQDAELLVNERPVAARRGRPIGVPAGPCRIELRRQGYFSHFAELDVVAGRSFRLEVRLRPEPF